MTRYKKMTVEELRAECERRGITWDALGGGAWYVVSGGNKWYIEARTEASALRTALEYYDRAAEKGKQEVV
jgi:hypothetical protein